LTQNRESIGVTLEDIKSDTFSGIEAQLRPFDWFILFHDLLMLTMQVGPSFTFL